jgi:hypothetical protein
VFRLAPTGGKDPSFGTDGKFRMAGRAQAVALDGRYLVVAGLNDANDPRRARIVRLWQ